MNNTALKRTVKVIRKKIKLVSLFLLLLTFSINAFAWFVYATKVDSGINAHVRAWNVNFRVGDNQIVEYINFDVSDIYPGMTTYTDSVKVSNIGESSATLSYEIVSVSILGEEYVVDENGVITSNDLINSLINDYPFKISINASNPVIAPNTEESFNLTVYWPFESGDDDIDTYWGTKAYDYHELNPDNPSIKLKLKISATQISN